MEKTYRAHVQFEAHAVYVKAKNAREAKKKVKEKVAKWNAAKLIDKNNFYIDEA